MDAEAVRLITTHDKLVMDQAWNFAKTTGYDFWDLYSYGRSVMIAKLEKWDPNKGKFSTFLTHCLRNALRTYVHQENRYVKAELTDYIPAPDDVRKLRWLLEFSSRISWEAMLVVELTLHLWDEGVLTYKQNRYTQRRLIQRTLMEQEWNQTRINMAFREIKRELRYA